MIAFGSWKSNEPTGRCLIPDWPRRGVRIIALFTALLTSPLLPSVPAADPATAPTANKPAWSNEPEEATADPSEYQVRAAWRADFREQTVIYRRVVPRELPPLPKIEPAPLTAAEAEEMRRKAGKKQEILFLSCTVYDRRVTEMRWEHEGQRYRAYSNIDGNLLRGLLEFQTEDTVYLLMLGIGEETEEALRAAETAAFAKGWRKTPATRLPAAEEFRPDRSGYFLAEDSPAPPAAALAPLDALHTYFDAHRASLIAACEASEARRLADELWRKEHPPVPKPVILHYWPLEEDPHFRTRKP